jgi:hypothetical protein
VQTNSIRAASYGKTQFSPPDVALLFRFPNVVMRSHSVSGMRAFSSIIRGRCPPNKSKRSFAKPKALASAEAASCQTRSTCRFREAETRAPLALDCSSVGPHMATVRIKLVTGVSTGALTAPFAFLGPEYDAALTDVYTNIDPSKVFKKRFLPLAALMQDAMADTSPLFGTISHYINEEMLAKIAAEYEKGRLLLIQTTDLDAGLPVLWNIGAIAASHAGRAHQRRGPPRQVSRVPSVSPFPQSSLATPWCWRREAAYCRG